MAPATQRIIVVGMSHQTAPVELRERMAFSHEALPEALTRLKQSAGLQECLILSTCNRVELYGVSTDGERVMERMAEFLSRHGRLDRDAMAGALYRHEPPSSVQHLFRVASGLESMVLGESEIIGQVKDAYAIAHRHGATGRVFNVLFQKALQTAKDVRTRTTLGEGKLSVGSVAVDLARKIFGHFAGCQVLLLGAGELGELVLTHLIARGAQHIVIASRSLEHAAQLADRYRGRATSLSRAAEELVESDIVIAAMSATQHLLRAEQAAQLMKRRRQRLLCLIDIAVPRNIDPAVAGVENVYLYNIDDLQGAVDGHRRAREAAAQQSLAIIQQKTQRFMEWLANADAITVSARDARERAGAAAG